ncbi:oxidoreductase [Sorangium cellulosum]|uniref:Oxidoreductase n=1 Tax=Sorangium cellulosum TaxID=56 RepID=A0A150R6K9_SORCE|nr:oxidoreductase [Sorangium cellulosum]
MTSPLLSPFSFPNGLTARNRVWLAPLTNQQSHDDGSLSEDELRWLSYRARGGFGVVETCAAHVAEEGKAWPGELGIFADRLLPGLRRLAVELATPGALGLVQLFHGGLRADPKLSGVPTWSASAVAEPDLPVPRAATEQDILVAIDRFRDAATRALAAGFAGVELHGAHGYLLGQFLSATQNRRTDRWGGAWENRARLLRETLRAVRAAVPASFVVGVRLSPEDFGQARGLDLDENLELARWLAEDGADFLHLSLWRSSKPSQKRPDKHPLPLFREAVGASLPLVVAGGVWTRAEAEALLDMGATAVALGRAAIANPDWPQRIADPAWEPRRPPLTRAELYERGISETFAVYLRRWKGFVAD